MERRSLVVVGHGMVGQRLVEALVERDALASWDITIVGEEPHAAYDRVALTSYLTGATAQELSLVPDGFFDRDGLDLMTGDPAVAIDRDAHTVTTASGRVLGWDHLVLATGSRAFVPPVTGADLPGCFVYRTIDDLDAIRAAAESATTGVVVGGGLLGLEAAGALSHLGLDTHVVEFAPRLLPRQVDTAGGAALQRRIEAMGLQVACNTALTDVVGGSAGHVLEVRTSTDESIACQLVVFAAGIRPRDDLARAAGLDLHDRGGILVDDALRTSDPAISAIGECVVAAGMVWGLVGPGYQMAEVVADRLLGGGGAFTGADLSTKLKLLGVDVASFGDAFATTDGAVELVYDDPLTNTYEKLVVSANGRRLLGGILVGDASAFMALRTMVDAGSKLPVNPGALLKPGRDGGEVALGGDDLPDTATLCSCHNVSIGAIREAVCTGGCTSTADVKACTRAGTGCGSCVPLMKKVVDAELVKVGVEVDDSLCEHFPHTRQQLFAICAVQGHRSFSDLIAAVGTGNIGCEICRPTVASILASQANGYVLAGEQAALQDSNDHMLANIQRDGTYSVVPRVPGGEITPQKLRVIADVAMDFGLYTKITGGQRIDLFGATADQLPLVWRRLVDAGFESGHAYGKAVRTVKSCVGQSWCRYGVQDSVGLAIRLELRYRGLRSPHKIKAGVSGCARECAEARSKDIGVIATEEGWNLYVGGNGGYTPRHAELLATDLDEASLVRLIDRFVMYYIRSADRLERTATWVARLDDGLDHLREVLLDDSLGLGVELDAMMAEHVATYECEWKRTLEDPESLSRFVTFVNAPGRPDPDIGFVVERDQIRPVMEGEEPTRRPLPILT